MSTSCFTADSVRTIPMRALARGVRFVLPTLLGQGWRRLASEVATLAQSAAT